MRYRNFVTALMQLGENDGDRANALGVHKKTIARYRNGQIPDDVERWMNRPELLRALADDAEVLNQSKLSPIESTAT